MSQSLRTRVPAGMRVEACVQPRGRDLVVGARGDDGGERRAPHSDGHDHERERLTAPQIRGRRGRTPGAPPPRSGASINAATIVVIRVGGHGQRAGQADEHELPPRAGVRRVSRDEQDDGEHGEEGDRVGLGEVGAGPTRRSTRAREPTASTEP